MVCAVAGLVVLLVTERGETGAPVGLELALAPEAAPSPGQGSRPLLEAEVSQPPQALISGAATAGMASIEVAVVSSAGEELPGITVSLVWDPDGRALPLVSGVTDERGRVSLECRPATYSVSGNSNHASPYHGYASMGVVARLDESISVTIVLPDADARLVVSVQDDAGEPLRGVEIEASGPAAGAKGGTRTTGDDGYAAWELIVAGSWRLNLRSGGDSVVVDTTRMYEVEVEPGQATTLDITLDRKATVILRPSEQLHGELLATATLREARDSTTQAAPWRDGEARWRVPAGEYVLLTRWLPTSEWWAHPVRLTVQPGEVHEIHLPVERGSVFLSGMVVDTDGVPVEGVRIRAVVRSEDPRGGSTLDKAAAAFSTKEAVSVLGGTWEVGGLPAGGITSVVVDTTRPLNRYLARYENPQGYPNTLTVLDPTRPVTVRVSAGVIVRGTARLPEGMDPSARWRWLVWTKLRASGGDKAWSDQIQVAADGSFEVKHVGPGFYSAVLKNDQDWESQPELFFVDENLVEGSEVPLVIGG